MFGVMWNKMTFIFAECLLITENQCLFCSRKGFCGFHVHVDVLTCLQSLTPSHSKEGTHIQTVAPSSQTIDLNQNIPEEAWRLHVFLPSVPALLGPRFCSGPSSTVVQAVHFVWSPEPDLFQLTVGPNKLNVGATRHF